MRRKSNCRRLAAMAAAPNAVTQLAAESSPQEATVSVASFSSSSSTATASAAAAAAAAAPAGTPSPASPLHFLVLEPGGPCRGFLELINESARPPRNRGDSREM